MGDGTARRLLILGCSQRKRQDDKLLPAIERYDGPAFRVVRRYNASQPESPLVLCVLSAQFGLIEGDRRIPVYDRQMTRERAHQLRPSVLVCLRNFLHQHSIQDVFVHLGKDYLAALDGWTEILRPTMQIEVAAGTPGKRLSDLSAWLYVRGADASPVLPQTCQPRAAQLRGVTISMTRQQVLGCAQHGIDEAACRGARAAYAPHAWYVTLGDTHVGVKWLVSHLTGVSVGAFHTHDAVRVLSELGVEVRRG